MTGYTKLMTLMIGATGLLSSCCYTPDASYLEKPEVRAQMADLNTNLLKLLPEEQSKDVKAKEEADWLVQTAYTKAREISEDNDTVFIGWINNMLVNSHIRKRGLCYHYQQDLYRELRRRPLHYFYLGLTVRDQGRGREHHCVYVNAKGKGLEGSYILDAWASCGKLKVIAPEDITPNWKEERDWQPYFELAFPEGHTYPFHSYIKTDSDSKKDN